MRIYYTEWRVGKSKYIVNFHDGVKQHKDGSMFFDIKIFSNKKKLGLFIQGLLDLGYCERGGSI